MILFIKNQLKMKKIFLHLNSQELSGNNVEEKVDESSKPEGFKEYFKFDLKFINV